MQRGLKDKTVLVVGAANAVGAAVARRLAAQGAKLALVDSDGGALTALAGEIGGAVLTITADTTDPRSAKTVAEQARARYGEIHVLVNNVTDPVGHGLEGVSLDSFTAAVSGTLGVQFAFMREVVPAMRKQGYGRVVNLSGLGYLGLPGGAETAAAQSGIFGLTRSLALEGARDHVTVNTVVKGDLASPGQSEEDGAKVAAGVPVKRLGTADDIAYAVSFFASDASKYVTGQTFFVCGGKSAYFSMSV